MLLCSVGFVLASSSIAGASGDPTLNRLIISNPEPGWIHAPSQEVSALQSIHKLTSSPGAGANAAGAVRAWRPPDGGGALGIELLNFPSGIPGLSAFSARNTCVHSHGSSVSVLAITGVPNSTAATCLIPSSSGNAMARASVAEAAKGNYVMLVFAELPSSSPTAISTSNLAAILKEQYEALPGGSGSTSTILVVLGLVVVLVAGVGLFLVWRNSRRAIRPAPVMASAEETLGPDWTGSPPLPMARATEVSRPPAGAVPVGPAVRTASEPEPDAEPESEPEPEPEPGPEPEPEPEPEQEPERDAGKPAPAAAVDASFDDGAQPAEEAPAEPGWYPDDGDETRQYYWDGQRVVARIVWNGTEWIEVD
jgi:hypothetical protein